MSENKFKIIMLGDFSVGKTSLIRRYVENVFDESYLTTIGVRVSQKSVPLNDGKPDANLLIWDIAGNDGLSTVIHQYIKGSSGAIITGDLTRKETLVYMNKYHALFKELCPERPVVFVLNKTDLLDGSTPDYVTRFKNEVEETTGYRVIFSSAKTGDAVEEIFREIASLMTVAHV
ncbi:MAG: GTP-binding protein [Spirochaetes bacterium]|nr:GTP-binding protein [Spirochaetota bacterium]